MYETEYGTDWDTLEMEAAIERAYALGVLAGLDEGRPEEYDRVCAAVAGGPGSEMVQLAYEEGHKAAVDLGAPDEEATWERLVAEAEQAPLREPDAVDEQAAEDPASAPPSSLSAMKPRETDPTLFEFPEFLRWD